MLNGSDHESQPLVQGDASVAPSPHEERMLAQPIENDSLYGAEKKGDTEPAIALQENEEEKTSSGFSFGPIGRCWRSIFPHGLLPHGSPAASGFNLASATLGAGTLSLPSAMASAGGVFGALFLLCCCAGTVYAIRLLIMTLEITGHATYEELARHLVAPWFEKLTAFFIVIFCWGITIVYVVAMGDILDPIRKIDGFPEVFQGTWGLRFMTVIFWSIFMLPLSLAKEINTLRYASLTGVGATVVLVTAVVVHSAQSEETSPSNLKPAKVSLDMILALPIIIFSYCCQTNAFEVYAELKDRSANKMTLIAGVSMAICTAIYITVGTAGAMEFGDNTEGNILKNFSDPTGTPYIAFAFVCMSLTLTMAFPICIFPTRDAVLQIMGFKSAYETPDRIRLLVCGSLATASVIAGLFVPGVSILFGLLGGICGSTLAFIWPAVFAMRTGKWTVENVGLVNVVATWVLLGVGVLSGVLGTGVSIYEQIKG